MFVNATILVWKMKMIQGGMQQIIYIKQPKKCPKFPWFMEVILHIESIYLGLPRKPRFTDFVNLGLPHKPRFAT